MSDSSVFPEQKQLLQVDPIKLLTRGYVIALLIVGIMSIAIQVTINRIVIEQDNVSAILGKSGEQMGLAQGVALNATLYVYTKDKKAHEAMTASVQKMEDLHRTLIRGGLNNVREFMHGPETLAKVYFDQPYNLNEKIVSFLYHGRNLAEKKPQDISPQDADYTAIMQQIDGTLGTALAAALSAYEDAIMYKIFRLQALQRMAVAIILITLICEAFMIFRPLVRRVYDYAEELKRMTLTDLLTGVGNRRFFVMRGEQEIGRGRRLDQPLCLAIIDLDYFKKVNDTYGHKSGDILLQKFVETAKKCLRSEDIIARIGGEEFAILLPNTSTSAAYSVMERLRETVAATGYDLDRDHVTRLTISVGLTRVNLSHDDFDTAMVLADIALYDAKRMGRNKVIMKDAETFFELDENDPSMPREQTG